MATSVEKETKTQKKSVRNQERTAFRVGEKVEFEGKLAKVIAFGYLEQTANPGENASFSKDLEAHLQLPAAAPGGKPDYARHVPVTEITSLRDNPKRQRELEIEFNALFGDPLPVEPSKENAKGPEIKKPGTITKAEDAKPAPRRAAAGKTANATNDKPAVTGDEVADKSDKPARTPRASRKAAK